MNGETTEIEAKFQIADANTFHTLVKRNGALPGYRFGEVTCKQVTDIYLDTPDYRLLRVGYQLRARWVDDRWLATLKSREVGDDEGIHRRLEIEEPLDGESPPRKVGELPPSIVETLGEVVDAERSLIVLCVLEQTRQMRPVLPATAGRRRKEDAVLAWLSLDEVCIRQSVEGPVLARTYEMEVELAPDVDVAELQVFADRLSGAYQLTPNRESKLERALVILSRHPVDSPESWQGLQSDMHMGEACRIIWQEQFMKLLLNEAGVRAGVDPEFVHDARVAIRRARAAAHMYESYFKPKAIRSHLKNLRHTARLLGAVRDLDVAIEKLEKYRQKAKKKSQADLQATLEQWRIQRDDARRTLLEWLDSPKYSEFIVEFLHFCRTPGLGLADMQPQPGQEVTPFQVRHVAPMMLVANFERVRAYEVWFEQPEPVPVETLHRLRIECKYLRYNLEFMAGLLGSEGAAIIALLRKLQDDLGDLNDAAVSMQLLNSNSQNGDAPTVTHYQRAQQKQIERLRKRLGEDFANFVAEENRTRLFSAIARL
ncbi:MAG: CHAD domain-containing protein [Caldilinea sp.]|nr:CHAD domain-containing protein [Caldilinea sp.]MDW8441208.1 CHAD domain-containing protein [Caldilineaceae bacterium]